MAGRSQPFIFFLNVYYLICSTFVFLSGTMKEKCETNADRDVATFQCYTYAKFADSSSVKCSVIILSF